jgi:ribosomal protein S18 acetylase RimI-like enzyme
MSAHALAPLPADTPDDRLALATEENLAALFEAMASHVPGAEIDRRPGLCRHHAFPRNPMFKGVWACSLDPANIDAAIDETVAWFEAREAPFFFWWTGPGTRPTDLGARLAARGLLDMAEQQHALAAGIHQTALGAPAMVADLARLDEGVLAKLPPGYRLVEVSDDAGLEHFKQVFVTTYEIPEFAGQAWLDATRAIGVDRAPWRIHVGYLDGAPVATNILFCGAGVASVYGVATLPEAQGKGIGAAVTLGPLLSARAAGYHHAVLFSTEKGLRTYQRLGFRDTGSRINRYMWRRGA